MAYWTPGDARAFGSARALYPVRKGISTEDKKMNEERDVRNVQETAAPRWMGIAVVVLAVISLVALGVGWSASNRSKALEQSLGEPDPTITVQAG